MLVVDAIGIVAMIVRRNRVALFIAVMGALSAAAVCLDPAGKLYNVRFLPFWFLCVYLMAGYAVGELVTAAARWNRRRRLDSGPSSCATAWVAWAARADAPAGTAPGTCAEPGPPATAPLRRARADGRGGRAPG